MAQTRDITPGPEAVESGCTLAESVVKDALALGATAAEASIGNGLGLSVEVRNGEVETVEHNRGRGMVVTVYDGHHKGSASTNDFSAKAVAETVEAALAIARHSGEDPHAGLADPDQLATEVPDLDLDHPAELDPEAGIAIALECEAAATGDERITNSEGASCAGNRSTQVYANSGGLCAGWTATSYSTGASVLTGTGDSMQRAHWYTSGRVFDELENADAVGRRACERAIARIGARKIASTKARVLYEAPAAATLFGHLVSAISGSALYRRASFLLDALGEQLFDPGMQIRERPRMARGPGSAPFDGDGIPTRDRDIVTGGELVSYVLAAYAARRLGLTPTGNAGGVRNLEAHMPAGRDDDFDAMLRRLDTGLLVTGLMGFGVNSVTGDYSRGATGFWVENGEVAYPVEEITVAGNLREMFDGIEAIGGDIDRRGNVHCGSVLIGQMTIAGD